ncbi:flagellar hook-associated protein FlgK [Pseudomonas matsuisoli]|uniref:Flagellar hook-associated protein 1 n=1 Tax=Pseudomonas matsuisoli TaxID=1515666 RepID=A0A917PIK6_9PSED|nr:flagellar hook-associated protein FlgK [Pseudomonas matsuisoli]GGJ80545.1 flagellar hook-associated protein FlgK [Pseudomonas matsuisoli]
MADLLSIGLSGLRTTQTSLTVTGHNIANINTPGYSRQEAVSQTNIAQFTGAGYIGSGSQTVDVRRLASDFLTSQLRTANSQNAELQAFKSQISQLDGLLSDATTGITPALQKFFATLQTASQDPSSIPAREAVLAQASGLSQSFNTLYDQLDKQNTLINQQLGALTGQVNSLAQSVGDLNSAIARTKAAGADPNDLIDQRDQAIKQLSGMIGIQVVNQDAGQVNLFIGSGQPLVVGTSVSQLSAVAGADDPSRFQIMLTNGGTSQNVTNQVSGGEMGGLLAYRDTALDQAYNTLGQLALTISDTVNKQLGQGLDLAGNAGKSLFKDINDPQSAALRVIGRSGNTSAVSGALNIDNTSTLTNSDYRLSFDGTNYTARRVSDNTEMTVSASGTPPTLRFTDPSTGADQGFSLSLSGTPNSGDVFTLQPTRRGASLIDNTAIDASQLAFAGATKATTGYKNASGVDVANRGSGVVGQPNMTEGSSPIDVTALKASLPLDLTANVTADGYTMDLPAGWSYVDKDGAAITPAPTFKAGEQSTVRIQNDAGQRFEFTLSGTPQQGDRFGISFNAGGVSDNRNAQNLVGLQTKPTIGGFGTTGATYTQSYGGLVERVGSLTAQVRTNSAASEAVLKQAQDNRDSLSAVNLDEEAAKLIQFQQYYSASAQVIQVARSLFDTLIGAFR